MDTIIERMRTIRKLMPSRANKLARHLCKLIIRYSNSPSPETENLIPYYIEFSRAIMNFQDTNATEHKILNYVEAVCKYKPFIGKMEDEVMAMIEKYEHEYKDLSNKVNNQFLAIEIDKLFRMINNEKDSEKVESELHDFINKYNIYADKGGMPVASVNRRFINMTIGSCPHPLENEETKDFTRRALFIIAKLNNRIQHGKNIPYPAGLIEMMMDAGEPVDMIELSNELGYNA